MSSGTYVGFGDLPTSWPLDYNYTDEQFVFTNVGVTSNSIPELAPIISLATGVICIVAYGWRRKA